MSSMLAMMLRPAGRVIDGNFVGRGQWVSVTSSKSVSGFFVGNVFVRGGGQGGGGDANTAQEPTWNGGDIARGERGAHGASATYNAEAISNPVITIGAGGSRGIDDNTVTTLVKAGTDGTAGGTTSIVYASTRSASGGSGAGRAAIINKSVPSVTDWSYLRTPISNPGLGEFGRQGGRNNSPPAYTYIAAQSGVVQIQLVD